MSDDATVETPDEKWERLTGRTLAQQEMLSEEAARIAKEKGIPIWTGLAIAGDEFSKRYADEVLEQGKPWLYASVLVGSYSRLDWIVANVERGRIVEAEVYPHLADIWSGSDPDDTDTRFWNLWTNAWTANRKRPLGDANALPAKKWLTIYRGQDEKADPGIAWSLDSEVAERFARGAATRQHNLAGVIYEARCLRKDVMGFMTRRGEAEVVVNPFLVGE